MCAEEESAVGKKDEKGEGGKEELMCEEEKGKRK